MWEWYQALVLSFYIVVGGTLLFTFGSGFVHLGQADMDLMLSIEVMHSLGVCLKGQTKVMKITQCYGSWQIKGTHIL